jgi:hypothetical protein
MSMRNRLGQHWKVQGNLFRLISSDERDPEQVKSEVLAVNTKQVHKCGGKVMMAAGLPRILGEWRMCSKCSAEVK